MPTLVIILLNWRNTDDTLACLAQLSNLPTNTMIQQQIVVIDNGSGGDAVDRLRAAHPQITLIAAPANAGFAGGVNQGLQYAMAIRADYALLLNSDITISSALITTLVESAQRDPQAGVLGPKVWHDAKSQRYSFYGFSVTRHGFRPLGWHAIDQGQFDHHPISAIPGCAMLISRQALERVGLMDTRFFFYFEDLDYCLRIQDAGLHVQVVPTVAIEHQLGGSTRSNPARRQFLLGFHRAIFLRKHAWRFQIGWLALQELRELFNQTRNGFSMSFPYLLGLTAGFRAPTPTNKRLR
ncbi:MAG: glycosyltransferase family 2 protein [Roseiflexaceae bacterium]